LVIWWIGFGSNNLSTVVNWAVVMIRVLPILSDNARKIFGFLTNSSAKNDDFIIN
jgi:hypothetical protein